MRTSRPGAGPTLPPRGGAVGEVVTPPPRIIGFLLFPRSTLPCSAAAGDEEAEPWRRRRRRPPTSGWTGPRSAPRRRRPRRGRRRSGRRRAACRGPRGSRRRWRERCSPRAAAGPPPGSTPRPPSPRASRPRRSSSLCFPPGTYDSGQERGGTVVSALSGEWWDGRGEWACASRARFRICWL
jgi:hypothetical protein